MNPTEQQIADAAPHTEPPTFPADPTAIPADDGIETVGFNPAGPTARKTLPWRGITRAILAAALFVAGVLAGSATLAPAPTLASVQASRESGEDLSPDRTSAEVTGVQEWRTAALLIPWADSSASVEATIELPATWTVERHAPSPDFPGLHATVADESALPVAPLYLGPTPETHACPLQPGPGLQLQQRDVTTGAELLDPALAAASAFGLSPGLQARGFFGLVSRTSANKACREGPQSSATAILRFGTVLGHEGRAQAEAAPNSSYARMFSSVEEAKQYMRSQEFSILERVISSLRISVPVDQSRLWQQPVNRHPSN
ncbi:hypothetical protein [Paenarthrobacter sp.]|uniref:hypothetical protein n=1 Tax=Paenarthrobacter sp. TaxID=1931993 RepID=UPI002811BF37|nr:hypothetical protein [Paenarthrobacter sp.]